MHQPRADISGSAEYIDNRFNYRSARCRMIFTDKAQDPFADRVSADTPSSPDHRANKIGDNTPVELIVLIDFFQSGKVI
ncbi:hypothetical protein ASD02_23170 [Ensifer sp. Root1252]|nr:hypothetical protein ASD02_23170 [Ensifer sp. Root1252]KRC77943.1 hypothetical protein ASE32_27780 [Ensifer sp. Root231]KRD00363.1 hypothetical protein ASE47_23740 [Ensifer sp. Root258]